MALKLKLKPNSAAPLYRQIEQAVRAAIAGGNLKPGERLPSAVDLAKDLGINKLTAVKAFQLLEKSGLVRSEVGRGTFVAASGETTGAAAPAEARIDVAKSVRRLREGFARGLREMMAMERPPGTINLSGGAPAPTSVPDDLLPKLARDALARNPGRLHDYAGPAGLEELRTQLAATLARRGIEVSPDEILITNGSQQAISLVGAWAREDGRTAISETPTHLGLPGALMLFGHAVQTVPWDGNGPNLEQLRALAGRERALFYVCPDFQNPTGLTMPTEARAALADFARRSDTCVLVDEIFREMRFEGAEPQSLYTMLPAGRRILVGSISKSFMPGLRVGYLVADRPLIAELLPYKRYMDLGCPSLVQAIAAAFLKNGYAKHLEKMRTYHRVRRDAALEALEASMPEGVRWTRPQGGFQLWVTMPAGVSSIQLFLQGIEQGVAINPGPVHDVDGRYLSCFRLGYAHPTPDEIRTGIGRLATIVESMLSRGANRSTTGEPGILI
jgi:GntR family transcriptional regulator / MocR family aminotransferase